MTRIARFLLGELVAIAANEEHVFAEGLRGLSLSSPSFFVQLGFVVCKWA